MLYPFYSWEDRGPRPVVTGWSAPGRSALRVRAGISDPHAQRQR